MHNFGTIIHRLQIQLHPQPHRNRRLELNRLHVVWIEIPSGICVLIFVIVNRLALACYSGKLAINQKEPRGIHISKDTIRAAQQQRHRGKMKFSS